MVQADPAFIERSLTRRFRSMVEDGALDECRAFVTRGLDPTLPSARVLGAPPLCAFLRGEMQQLWQWEDQSTQSLEKVDKAKAE